jgi:hypothetical protein
MEIVNAWYLPFETVTLLAPLERTEQLLKLDNRDLAFCLPGPAAYR